MADGQGLEPGTVRADDAPAELNAPAQGAQGGTPAAAPALPPPETRGTPPVGMTRVEPDLSEAGLAAEAARAAGEKPAEKADDKPAKEAKAKTESEAAAADPAADATPAPAEPDAAKEPAKAEEPAPKLGKEALRLRNRELKLVEQQTQFARERQEFEQSKARTQQELDRQRGEVDRGKQALDLAHKVVTLANQDPLKLLENLGYSREMLAERLLNDGKVGPQELAARGDQRVTELERALQAQREEHAKQIEALKQEMETDKKAAQEASEKVRLAEVYANFVRTARADEKRWPLASRYTEKKLIAHGDRIADERSAAGHRLSHEEILDAIEEELGEVAGLATRGKTPSAAAAQAPHASSKTTASPQATPGTVRNQPAPTLTSAAAAERVTDAPPIDPLTASEEEIMAATLAEIERQKSARAKAA